MKAPIFDETIWISMLNKVYPDTFGNYDIRTEFFNAVEDIKDITSATVREHTEANLKLTELLSIFNKSSQIDNPEKFEESKELNRSINYILDFIIANDIHHQFSTILYNLKSDVNYMAFKTFGTNLHITNIEIKLKDISEKYAKYNSIFYKYSDESYDD